MKKIFNILKVHQTYLVFFLHILLSISTFLYYFYTERILLFGDANARLNIARGVIDNLTPGFGQLSNVWLPLPTLLMLPFIWNNYLWHSGIAGAVVSMASYIIGGVYLYKSARILSNSFFTALFATLIYSLNINILYLQTTAMSESIFICSLIIAIYNFLVWMKESKKILHLIYAGVAVTAASLIRYEGWAIMFTSIPMVALYLWIKTKNYKQTEGKTILYATIAVLGFLLWTIYLTAIYGDPLFWKHVYLTQSFKSSATGQSSSYTFHLTLLQAGWRYLTAVAWMNGIIPLVLALFAVPILIINFIKSKNYYFLPLLIQLSIFAFMILTLQRNTPINQPTLTIANILSPKTLKISEFNIRYGLTLLPLIALLTTYLLNIRSTLLKLLVVLLFAIQIYSYFNPIYSIIYQIPIGNNVEMIPASTVNGDNMVIWLRKHYDGGLIMISALKHNPEMLELGFEYKTYIQEGTEKYWKTSIKTPQKYATWIVFSTYLKDDNVTKFLESSRILKEDYTLVYNKEGMKIYKIKTKPEVQIED